MNENLTFYKFTFSHFLMEAEFYKSINISKKKSIGRYCGQKGTISQEVKSDANDVIIVFKQGFTNVLSIFML